MSTGSTADSDGRTQWPIPALLPSHFPGRICCLPKPITTYEDAGHALLRILLQLLDPLGDVFVGVSASQVEDQEGSRCPLVIGMGNGPIPLLASCVPNLYLDLLAIEVNGLGGKLDADGGL